MDRILVIIYTFLMYSFVIGFTLLFTYKANNSKNKLYFKVYSILAVLIPTIFAGMRALNVGTDIMVYAYQTFEKSSAYTSLNSFLNVNSIEGGYAALAFICSHLCGNVHVFLAFTAMLQIIPIYICAVKLRNEYNMIWPMMIYLMIFYIVGFNVMRQSIAASWMLLAFLLLEEKRYVKMIFTCIVESSACFGDASMFSFHATKVFNTIEGGCVCFKDDSWIQLLNDMKNFGIHGPESVQFVGANAKMNEFQAAMGICNLKHLDEEIEKRKHVVEHYRSRLEGVEGIKLSIIQKDVESNYAYFPVVFDGYKYTRNEIFEKLVEVGIGARKYFYPLTNSFECYRNYPTAGAEKTPIAQHIALRVLTLPLYADLSLKDVDRICDVILG